MGSQKCFDWAKHIVEITKKRFGLSPNRILQKIELNLFDYDITLPYRTIGRLSGSHICIKKASVKRKRMNAKNFTYIHIYAYMDKKKAKYIYIYIYMYALWLYMYCIAKKTIYMYTYIHIYIYIYTLMYLRANAGKTKARRLVPGAPQ